MQLMWQPDESPRAITGVDGHLVRMGADWRTRSFWVNARATAEWAPACLDDVDEAALDELLQAEPEVILLGTGARTRLLAPLLQAKILRHGCGIESMDNAAAARTYNVLLGEGRAVLAAFLIS